MRGRCREVQDAAATFEAESSRYRSVTYLASFTSLGTFDSVKRGGRMGHVLGKEEEWEKEGFPLVAWEGG